MFFLNLYRRVKKLEKRSELTGREWDSPYEAFEKILDIHRRCAICCKITHEPTTAVFPREFIYGVSIPVHPSCLPGSEYDRRAAPRTPEKRAE